MILLVTVKLGDLLLEVGINLIADVFGCYGQVQTERLPVLGNERSVQERDSLGFVADGESFFPALGWRCHEPFKSDRTWSGLLDVFDGGRGYDIDLDDPDMFVRIFGIRPAQGLCILSQFIDLGQRSRIKDTVRMGFVHHPQNHHVIEGHLVFHLAVKHTNGLILGKHVLWISVHLQRIECPKAIRPDTRQARQQKQAGCYQDHNPGNELGMIH